MAENNSILKLKYDFPKCSICLEELKANLAVNPCGHVFHVFHIDWYKHFFIRIL